MRGEASTVITARGRLRLHATTRATAGLATLTLMASEGRASAVDAAEVTDGLRQVLRWAVDVDVAVVSAAGGT
jgi:hypothetical protein